MYFKSCRCTSKVDKIYVFKKFVDIINSGTEHKMLIDFFIFVKTQESERHFLRCETLLQVYTKLIPSSECFQQI